MPTRTSTLRNKLSIAITPGDPDGIGPEVTKKALKKLGDKYTRFVQFTIIGDASKLRGISPKHRVLPAPKTSSYFLPGFQSGWSIEVAAKLCLSKECDAMVTGPISKERLQRGGYLFNGHTDMLAKITQTPRVTMMLLNQHLRVALVTTHMAIKNVPGSLTQTTIERTILQVSDGMRSLFGIKKPKIAVLGLNPHAGESGLFGNEEKDSIEPAVSSTHAFGPFPADTFFALENAKSKKDRYDVVVGMYHDQVLIPVKLLDFSHTVNLTLGLPIIRTSVDHGTAFDIAGKNKANPDSMVAAIELAIELSLQKRKGKET